MKQLLKNIFFACVLLSSLQSMSQFSYKITIQGDPLVKNVNGSNIAGETNVRIKIYGDNDQTLLGGKLCIGDFATVTIKDKPDIGSISGLDIELTGKGWTNPVKVNNINVKKESDDGSVNKKYSFSCGCLLTQGNSKVQIDEAGAMNFNEADVAGPEFKLEGEFSTQEISFTEENIKGTISRTRVPKGEKPGGAAVVNKTPKQICTEEPVDATASFDINFIQNPNDANIFPGAMLYSEDIANGSYASYASGSDLNPINLTTTIAIVGGNPTITVVDPDLGSINTAINDLLINQTKGEMEVQASFEVSEINSMEELTLKLGAHFNSATFDARLSADLNTTNQKSIKMVKFVQKYYTVTMVQPKKPIDLFKNKLKAIEALQSGKTPLYVNSITYGRVCYFFMESEQSTSDFKAHLEAEYHGSVTAGGEVDLETKKDVNSMKYSATIIGGSGANGILAVNGFNGFMQMLQDDGKLEKTALALPISYSCKFLADNKQAFVNLFSSYTKRTCKPVKSDRIKAVLKLEKITYVSGDRDEVRWGVIFEAKTYKTEKTTSTPFLMSYKKAWAESDRPNFIVLKKGSAYEIDVTTAPFEFNIADFQNGEQKIDLRAAVVKIDWGVFGDDYTSAFFDKTVMMKDALKLDSGPAAIPKTFVVQYEDAKLEFTYKVEILNQ
ncbi:MAG: thiol-activated cytolysin family protein [Bacteroidota bacterium]